MASGLEEFEGGPVEVDFAVAAVLVLVAAVAMMVETVQAEAGWTEDV